MVLLWVQSSGLRVSRDLEPVSGFGGITSPTLIFCTAAQVTPVARGAREVRRGAAARGATTARKVREEAAQADMVEGGGVRRNGEYEGFSSTSADANRGERMSKIWRGATRQCWRFCILQLYF